jgi:Transposase IS66 family
LTTRRLLPRLRHLDPGRASPRGARSAFGPRLQAAVVTLAVRNRVSRRDTTELAQELFGVELATGSVDAIIQRAGDALAGPYTELEQRIKTAAAVNIDGPAGRPPAATEPSGVG